MPIITGEEKEQPAGAVLSLTPATVGLLAVASAPTAEAATGAPAPTAVVGWVLVGDAAAAGGARVDPVFLAGGRAWTPDQYRGEFGEGIEVTVKPG
jgi:hypothetical protein